MRKITHTEVYAACHKVIEHLKTTFPGREHITCYPVPRGGVPAAYALGECGRTNSLLINIADTPEEADFVLDDLIDSGNTMSKYREKHSLPFIALFDKRPELGNLPTNEWVQFPWEGIETHSADDIPLRLLQYIGEDVKRGGLKDTPRRYLKAWKFWTSGYAKDPKDILKEFEDGGEKYDEMVLVRDIPFYSQCEHHLAPFFGVVHVAYLPDGKIVGLSKFNRLVDMFARRLQVQERLTSQIAEALMKHLKPKGVAVVIEARHMCMESRGVCQQGHSTVTSAMLGAFKDEHDTRAEFLQLIKG